MAERRPDPAVAWFLENWNELRAYEFQWVATDGFQFVVNPDLDELIGEVIRREMQDRAVYAFVQEFADIGWRQ